MRCPLCYVLVALFHVSVPFDYYPYFIHHFVFACYMHTFQISNIETLVQPNVPSSNMEYSFRFINEDSSTVTRLLSFMLLIVTIADTCHSARSLSILLAFSIQFDKVSHQCAFIKNVIYIYPWQIFRSEDRQTNYLTTTSFI